MIFLILVVAMVIFCEEWWDVSKCIKRVLIYEPNTVNTYLLFNK